MKLVLYKFEACPYCQLVLQHIKKAKIEKKIDIRDTKENKTYFAELKEITGGTQVPCLVIDGKPMLESGDIVEWLSENVKA